MPNLCWVNLLVLETLGKSKRRLCLYLYWVTGGKERRLYLYLCWVTGGKEREETVPVPGLGHRWESEKEDCAHTCARSQVGKRERRLCLYLCWVTGGKETEETVPIPVPGHT